jgi:hypothetical protein
MSDAMDPKHARGGAPFDYDPRWDLKRPRSMWELVQLRTKSINEYREGMIVDEFTCDHCAQVSYCSLAFDIYNTDGECLYAK